MSYERITFPSAGSSGVLAIDGVSYGEDALRAASCLLTIQADSYQDRAISALREGDFVTAEQCQRVADAVREVSLAEAFQLCPRTAGEPSGKGGDA